MKEKTKFLSNKPSGKDLFDGLSQEKVAEAIKQHIKDIDNMPTPESEQEADKALPRIIGIEGSWGSGKSNTILQLQEKLKSDYYFFTYDAWGNQEDLQRRALLQQLTMKLVGDKMLDGTTNIKIVTSALDFTPKLIDCSWTTRVETLISRKSATHNITVPTIYESTKYFALMIIVTGILVPLLNAIKGPNMPCWYPILAFIAALTPLVAFALLMYNKHKEREETEDLKKKAKLAGWSWKEMWQMYQTSGRTDTSTFTVSEMEPSVTEFREWMTDLSNAMAGGKKLVIVFDNMDRLPKEKVRQLWSSIQTFFADKGYPKVWCIIPFDREHLANAFSEADGEDNRKKLTNYFIEKTFPVVYRIPDPIVKDYRKAFRKLFEEAFGECEEQDVINRCYRRRYAKPNMRDIISFINKCVSLEHIWHGQVKITSIAIFLLNQKTILDNKDRTAEDVILEGGYLGVFKGIVERNEDLDTEISALVYGVDKKEAAQIPLKNYLGDALKVNKDIKFDDYSKERSNFFVILDEVTEDMEPNLINNAINHIATINREGLDKEQTKLLDKVWNKLGNMYLKDGIAETDFRKEVRILMDECPAKAMKEKVGKMFMDRFTSDDNQHEGRVWFDIYKRFSIYVTEKGLNIKLPTKVMKADNFNSYVKESNVEYKNYPITCDNNELNTAAIGWIADGVGIIDTLRLLKDDERFDFSELLNGARTLIEGESANDQNLPAVLGVCKELSEGPMNLKVSLKFLDTLNPDGDIEVDILVLEALEGNNLSKQNDDVAEKMAELVYQYTSTAKLWELSIAHKTPVLSQLMGLLIEKNMHEGNADGSEDILTGMANIQAHTGVDYELIIKFVNDWGKIDLNDEEQKLQLPNVFDSESWAKAFVSVKNDLAKAVLRKYYAEYNNKTFANFMNANNSWLAYTSSYWLRNLKYLIDDEDFMKTCSKLMIELTNHLIEGICNGNIAEGGENAELERKLLSWVKFDDVSSKVNEMLGKFSPQFKINMFKFKSLHHYFEQTRGQEPQLLNNVLKPIINHEEVQKIILENLTYYENLIKNNIDQASDLKSELIKLHENNNNDELKEFVERLGFIAEKKEESNE